MLVDKILLFVMNRNISVKCLIKTTTVDTTYGLYISKVKFLFTVTTAQGKRQIVSLIYKHKQLLYNTNNYKVPHFSLANLPVSSLFSLLPVQSALSLLGSVMTSRLKSLALSVELSVESSDTSALPSTLAVTPPAVT